MKKNTKIAIFIIVLLLAVTVATLGVGVIRYNRSGVSSVKNVDEGIEVVANRAGEGGGVCYIEAKEGEKLIVTSNIEKGAISIRLYTDVKNDEPIINKTFKKIGTYEFDVPAGKYSGMCLFSNKTTGTLTVQAVAK